MSVSTSSSAALMGWNSAVHPCKACAAAYLLASQKTMYAYPVYACVYGIFGSRASSLLGCYIHLQAHVADRFLISEVYGDVKRLLAKKKLALLFLLKLSR